MSDYLLQSNADLQAKWKELELLQEIRILPAIRLDTSSSKNSSPWSLLPEAITAARNRYPMAEPFASHRVKLKLSNGANDYINASPIQLGTKKYIAAQGPKETTVNHFYRMMVAEARSPVLVVMLGPTHENGSEKCFPYYPESVSDSPWEIPVNNESQDDIKGSVVIDNFLDDSLTQSQIRQLLLRTSDDGMTFRETKVVHFLFEAWPNHSVPSEESATALLELIRLVYSRRPAPDTPVIVHCSAGCGRTGTFIALDYLLSLLKAGELGKISVGTDPVFQVVNDLRKQRMAMIQKEDQFYFIYKVLREQMEARRQQLQLDA